MTREKEIENKAIEKSAEYRFEQLYSYNNDVYSGFIQEAQWADKNPKSPWISVKDDLPCNHEELWLMTGSLIHTKKVLVVLIDGTIRLLSMLYDEVNNKWKWESKDNIIFWTLIPELPKE